MKKIYTLLFSIFFITLFSLVLHSCSQKAGQETEENDKYDGAGKALEFEIERTKDPATGKVPWGKLWDAMQQTEQSKNSSNLISALSWSERGPNGDFTVGGNPRPVGAQTAGRIRACMIDSLDATHNTVWVGGIDGGLWKTTNINNSPANWTLVNDFLANLAVSAICQDPRPGFQNNMYFCTGESFGNGDAVRGIGVFKSTDAGATWNFLPSTSTYLNGTRILCDYQGNVYLGTRNTGLLRSTDGGSTWVTITPAGIGTSVCDLEINTTGQAARLHVATGIGNGNTSGYSYTDIPATVTSGSGWTAAASPYTSFNARTELGISGNTLYASPINSSGNVPTIWKSSDGGANWTATTSQPNGANWTNTQGWYDLSCAINPANSNEVIVGALDTWKTTNGGASWTQLSSWATATPNFYVHADQHNIQWWDGGTKLMFTCDGGVWYSTDGGATKTDRNKGLRLKQFYSVAIHPTKTNFFIAGAQDNGMHRLDHPGLDSSAEVVGGDGCYAAIDQNNGNFQFGSYVYNVYRRSTNGGLNWTTPINNQSTGRFVNPWDYDNNNFKLYACNNAGTFLRWNDPRTGASTDVVTASAFAGGNVSAVHVSPYTANRVYFGTGSAGIIQVDNADVGTSLTGTMINAGAGMTGYVNCVVTGSDDQHLMACFSNYGVQNIWVTTNGGTTWTAIDGNLPDMPVRWALFHPDTDTKAFIATETGVWETDLINGASTVWNANNTFPNVRTDMIKYRASDRTIAAGTHGRGIWSATVNASCVPASITTHPSSTTICAGNNTSFTVVAAGSAPLTYQWQLSTTGAGGPWNNISNGGVYSGATTPTLTITGATIGMNTYQYRAVVTGNCAPLTATSNPAILTVNAATVVTGQPANSSICAGANTSFSVTATGSSVTYQWQVSTNGGASYSNLTNVAPYSNVTAATMNITAATAGMDGYLYRCVISSACTPINSNAALLTVNSGPTISSQPSNSSVCAGNAATFTVAATGGGLTYQWQESTTGAGGPWNNLSNAAPYSGVTTSTLTINPTAVGMNNYQYRCVVSGSCPSPVNSNPGILTVGTALTITSQPASQTVCAGATTSFSVTISGTVISYQWQESINGGANWNNITNGGVYSGATTAALTLTGVTAGMNTYQYRCVVTGSCPAINSNAAILTVNTSPAVTSQPANSIICGGNTAFSITATGTNITYQWQVNTAGCTGGTWNNLSNTAPYSGVTTTTLTITGATPAINGYGYRCVVTGTCAPAATSNCALLTVNTPVNITSQPSNSTICAGAQTSFTVGATGTTPTYQWQESTNGGGTWNNITNGGVYSGANTATLTLTGVTAGMSGYQYRAIVSGAAPCGSATSNAATLFVNTAPAITTQPVAGSTICEGQNTSYSVSATGTALTYQWQLSTDGGTVYTNLSNGGVYSGVNTSTLSLTGATAGMNNNRYRVVIIGTCAPAATSSAAVLTVNTAITITTPPAAATICATGTTSFSVTSAGTSPTYQWQVSTTGAGGPWTNISNGGIYSGATTSTLTLTGVTAGMNGYLYRVVVNGTAACGSVNSASAALTVSAQPTVTLTASPYTKLLPGKTTTITATVTPATGFTTVWTLNGSPITVTGNSKVVSVNELGTYTVVATIGSCISVPASITISDSVSSKLFIYPSPNDGRFTISYYSPGASNSNKTTQNITIYATDGRIVLNKVYDVTQPYQLHKMDLRAFGSGVYYVVLREANGNKIKTGEVVVR